MRIINNIIKHLRFDGAELLHGCCTTIVLNPLQDQAHDVDAEIKIKNPSSSALQKGKDIQKKGLIIDSSRAHTNPYLSSPSPNANPPLSLHQVSSGPWLPIPTQLTPSLPALTEPSAHPSHSLYHSLTYFLFLCVHDLDSMAVGDLKQRSAFLPLSPPMRPSTWQEAVRQDARSPGSESVLTLLPRLLPLTKKTTQGYSPWESQPRLSHLERGRPTTLWGTSGILAALILLTPSPPNRQSQLGPLSPGLTAGLGT